jgi:hypothetical protein
MSDRSAMVVFMLDHEKPRRSRSEERSEIVDLIRQRQAYADDKMFGVPGDSLAMQVARMKADEEARLDARDRAETRDEREAAERLRREEAETRAEAPFLHAKERQRQAAAAARRLLASEHSRQAS